jgi:hypothetical protein
MAPTRVKSSFRINAISACYASDKSLTQRSNLAVTPLRQQRELALIRLGSSQEVHGESTTAFASSPPAAWKTTPPTAAGSNALLMPVTAAHRADLGAP